MTAASAPYLVHPDTITGALTGRGELAPAPLTCAEVTEVITKFAQHSTDFVIRHPRQ